jgi:hypothetical protein
MAVADKPPTQEEADSQEVARLVSEGKRVAHPDLRRRIEQRAEQVRKESFAKHGVTNIAAELTDPDEGPTQWLASMILRQRKPRRT